MMNKSAFIALTVPWGNVVTTGESNPAAILTVAPPSPTTMYWFLEAAGAGGTCRRGCKYLRGWREERNEVAIVSMGHPRANGIY